MRDDSLTIAVGGPDAGPPRHRGTTLAPGATCGAQPPLPGATGRPGSRGPARGRRGRLRRRRRRVQRRVEARGAHAGRGLPAAAGRRAGGRVRRHVCVSIVGSTAVPMGPISGPRRSRNGWCERGPVPWSLVRRHAVPRAGRGDRCAPAARWRVLPVPRAALRPVACAEAARAVADVAGGRPAAAGWPWSTALPASC